MKQRVLRNTSLHPTSILPCFPSPNLGTDIHTFLMIVPSGFPTSERGNRYHGWAICTDGGTRVVDGETLAGWGVISRSLHGRIDVMFGPVQRRLRSPCNTCMVMVETWVTNVLITLLHLAPFGLISNHNIATRCVHQNFDATVCFNCCCNIGDVLERLQHIRTNATSLPHDRG